MFLSTKKNISFIIFEYIYICIDKPFVILTLLLSIKQEFTGFDCLTRTVGGGGVVVFSSDFICRGGTGGGGRRFVAFIFDSFSRNITIGNRRSLITIVFYLPMVNHSERLE
jgi:hypothetical protein